MSLRTDIADAGGLSVALISYVLNMSAYALGGVDRMKPGSTYTNDGRRLVVKEYNFDLYPYWKSTDAFKWAMVRSGLDEQALADAVGVPRRVILDITKKRTNLRTMKARTLFPMCKVMDFHPFFLYGMRKMDEYGAYLNSLRAREERQRLNEEARQYIRDKQQNKDDS